MDQDVLRAAARMQSAFTEEMAATGYTTRTSFYSDLSIGELIGGAEGVRDTYRRVCQEWRGNVEYYTEFVLCLNSKIWQHYKTNEPLARVYNELWRDACNWAAENLKGDELAYYQLTTR